MVDKDHILVVDDDVTLAENISRLMRARGFAVSTVHEGHSALARIKEAGRPIQAVLLDIRMPGMDGLETLRRIKSDFDIPVIILTGHADLEYGIEAIREGAFDFMIKPCPVEDLAQKIRNALDLGQIRRRPVLWPRTTAGELLLYSFIKLYPEDPLSRAVEIFASNQFKMAAETLFVSDHEDRLSGLITRKALLTAARQQHPEVEMTWDNIILNQGWLPSFPISRLMVRDVIWTHPEQKLKELAQIMMDKRFRSIPVVEDERMIGVVRLRDILRYLHPDDGQEGDA